MSFLFPFSSLISAPQPPPCPQGLKLQLPGPVGAGDNRPRFPAHSPGEQLLLVWSQLAPDLPVEDKTKQDDTSLTRLPRILRDTRKLGLVHHNRIFQTLFFSHCLQARYPYPFLLECRSSCVSRMGGPRGSRRDSP